MKRREFHDCIIVTVNLVLFLNVTNDMILFPSLWLTRYLLLSAAASFALFFFGKVLSTVVEVVVMVVGDEFGFMPHRMDGSKDDWRCGSSAAGWLLLAAVKPAKKNGWTDVSHFVLAALRTTYSFFCSSTSTWN